MKIKENYVMREVAGQANRTGRDVWTCLKNGMDLNETVKEIVDKYEVDSNIVAQDVEKMVDKLYKVGVLEK